MNSQNVHAHVSTAQFLMNFRTHHFCLSCTSSDNVTLQQETETAHVSNFQLLRYSQLVGLGLVVGFLANGVKHHADILEDARDFTLHALKF